MSEHLFPDDDKGRKMLPVFSLITRYFPKALREVTRVAVANNVRFNPGRDPADINWARGKSPDQLGSAFRHMMERTVDGKVFEEVRPEVTLATGISRIYVLGEAAWRVLAELELEIERQELREVGVESSPRAAVCWADPMKDAPVLGCECEACRSAREDAVRGI